jgi:transposase
VCRRFCLRKELAVKNRMTYVGLDVHDLTIVAVWRRAEEERKSVKVANDEKGIERLVKEVGTQDVWAVYETSGTGFVLHDQLTAMRWKVDVLATTKIPKSVRGKKRKTDIEDAVQLMNLLMAHGECGAELPNVWIPPVKIREDREVERHRLKLGDVVGQIKTRIKSILKVHGVRCPLVMKSPWTLKYRAWIRALSTPEGGLVRSLWSVLASEVRMLEAAEQEVQVFDGELERLSGEKAYQAPAEAVTKIKGVGLVTAMTFLLELGDMERFSNSKKVGCYLGLTPTSHESGQATDRKGHITRMGPWRIRKVLNQAAWALLRGNPLWKEWYEQLKLRRGTKKALVAVMRKLGILMWHRASEAVAA